MKKVIILIPPSEGKTSDGTHPSLKKVSRETQHIIDLWKNVSKNEWGKILGVKGKALEKAIEINTNILFTKTLPAIERYSGVVYNAINYRTLTSPAKNVFDDRVRIVSAVFGLLSSRELIPDYRCKINNFSADKFWRTIHSKALKNTFVIDLLPQAHQKAIEYSDGFCVGFHFLKNGKRVPAGHHGKQIKGKFVRWLVQQPSIDEETLKGFRKDGFRWVKNSYVKN